MANEVAEPCAEHKEMCEDWTLIDNLRGGTRAMRCAGETYLPRRPMEERSDYENRLAIATLLPAFTETVARMKGRVFAEPMTIGDDVPEWIKKEVVADVDRQGRSLEVFCAEWFDEGLSYGLDHVIVESPQTQDVKTRSDQARAGVRPYLIRVHPRNVLGWKTDANGKLIQLRVFFCRQEESGEFGTATVEEVRVYEPNLVRVFRKSEEVKGKEEWVEQLPPIATTMADIPLVTFYTKRTGYLTASPPLRELAFLNAKHWRMQSSNDELIETAQVPILLMTGVNDGDQLVIGAKHAVRLSTHEADLKYVEHTGKAISAGRDALKDLVDDMKQAGAKLLEHDIAKTESQANEDATRDNSSLGGMVRTFQDTIAQLLDVIASWRGEKKGGTVQLNPNLDVAADPNALVTSAVSMFHEGIISKQTVFEVAQANGVLPDDIEWKDEQARVAEEPLPTPTTKTPPIDSSLTIDPALAA
jgi:uncharacterized protein DUF4055